MTKNYRISRGCFEKSYSNCMVETGRKPILSLLPSKGVEFAPFEIRVVQQIPKPRYPNCIEFGTI